MSYKNQALRSNFPSWYSAPLTRLASVFAAVLCLAAPSVSAQEPIEVTDEVLKAAMREADSFTFKEGSPPVYRGYKGDANSADAELVGYLFEPPDYPPEEIGYSAPVDVLVGIDMDGTLTGIEVLHYIESYKSIRGDFINSEYFPQQFADKNIVEDFRVGRDIDGISRATITSWAVARGVRDSARKVAQAYLPDSEYVAATSGDAVALRVFEEQSWDDMIESGLVQEMLVVQPDQTELHLSLAFMGHGGLG